MMQDLIAVNGQDLTERCQLGSCIVDLPEDICEQRLLFREVLSEETWNTVLSSDQRNYLLKFLPRFPENDALNKQQTIRNLLSGANFWFGNPLDQFHKKLRAGHFSPDVAQMMSIMEKAKYREYRHRQQRYFYKLLQDILISRKKLMEMACRLPPDQPLRMDWTSAQANSHSPLTRPPINSVHMRAKRRYAREIQEVREEVGELQTSSEDDNYPDAVPPKLTKKQKKHLSQLEASLAGEVGHVTSTMAPKPPPIGSSHNHIIRSISPFEVNDDDYRNLITAHKRRRADTEFHLELDVDGITLHDISLRANVPKRSSKSSQSESASKSKGSKEKERKKGSVPPPITIIKTEPGMENPEEFSNITPLLIPKLEPVSSPVDLDDANFNQMSSADTANADDNPGEMHHFMESTDSNVGPNFGFALPRSSTPVVHVGNSSFFSLLRDFFYESYDCKILPSKLEEKVATWQDSSYSTLKDWYLLRANWVELVEPALKFLSGQVAAPVLENFVPLVDYKAKLQYYHWSGEGRDSDENLAALSTFWLDARSAADDERAQIPESGDSTSDSPPPPRVLTDWLVQVTTDEEKSFYREQERHRYESPHRAFTFCLHGYEAIVGPVKGVYDKDGSVAKAREHSLLTRTRPPFVTILSLVRDSAARLPNGEGTRADICELLKDSQFLAPATDAQIHTVVSGALDRLHYEKDPCVKYDVNRKMWIYLHRCRTEEEFERIHQVHASTVKTKKLGSKGKSKSMRNKSASRPASAMSTASSDSLVSLEISNTSLGGTSVSTGSFSSSTSPAIPVSTTVVPASKSRATASTLKLGALMSTSTIPDATLSVSSPTKPAISSSGNAKTKSGGAQKASKKRIPIIPSALSSASTAVVTSTVVSKTMPSIAGKGAAFSQPSTHPIAAATLSQAPPSPQIPMVSVSSAGSAASVGRGASSMSTYKSVSQIVGKVDIPECVIQAVSDTVAVSSPSVSGMQASSRPFSSSGLSQAHASPKASAAHPVVNLAQVQLVCTTTSSSSSILPVTVSTASARLNVTTQPSALQQQQQQQKHQQQQLQDQEQEPNKSSQKQQPVKTFGVQMHAASRPVTVNAQSISAVRLVPSGIGPTQSSVAFNSKALGGSSPLAGQPMSNSNLHLQGPSLPLPTFVIKQQDVSVGSGQVTTVHHPQTKAAPMKPVVARIISSPQVVSVGNLIASTLAATQKQGSNVQGTTTIKIQGTNLLHPMGNKTGHLNVLKTPSSPCPSAAFHQVSTSLTGIPRLALVTQGNATNLIPGQVSKPAILTSAPAGLKIVSTATTPNMPLSQLAGKTTQTMVMTSKPQTPIVTVSVGTASSGTAQNLILTSSGVQPSSAMPAVMIASRSLKPTQTVMMAQRDGSATPTVVMTAQPTTLRPIAPTTSTTSVIGPGAVKVVPMAQTSTAFGSKAIGKAPQQLFTRIITPPASLAIRPGGLAASTQQQQGIGVFHAMAGHHLPSGNQSATARAALQQATIIRVQAQPQMPSKSQPDHAKEPR